MKRATGMLTATVSVIDATIAYAGDFTDSAATMFRPPCDRSKAVKVSAISRAPGATWARVARAGHSSGAAQAVFAAFAVGAAAASVQAVSFA